MSENKIVVLVVEDELIVRMDIAAELEEHGLQVLEASNALEAIAILDEHPAVNVLFTDVDMPGGLDGLKLARIVKERDPAIQVIVTSGHRRVGKNDLPVQSNFLPKPYVPEKVVKIILEIAAQSS